MQEIIYPDQYLRVYSRRDGETFIMPIAENQPLDIDALIHKWVKYRYGDDDHHVHISRPVRGLREYDAAIITDGRPPDSCIVWSSAEFDLIPKE
jgi:hypothetical protein